MVNVSQGAVALGVLTLLFGGDLYSMFGQPAEVDKMAFVCTTGSLCAQLISCLRLAGRLFQRWL